MRRLVGLACAVALAAAPPDFHNVAPQAGLTRPTPNGGRTSKQYIVETTGSGVAFVDYDNDGLPDVFIASGPGERSRMYRNIGDGRFADVSDALGFSRQGWAQGVCAGDYDNDGYTDLFVTYWGQNALYRNAGGKRFVDVTNTTGLARQGVHYNTGCAFLDYDNDGRLDLFVANYLKFDFETTPRPAANPYCFYRGVAVSCGPRGLPFDRNLLYHNEGLVFRDVSDESGISGPSSNYSLGVLTGDFNGDGLTDIFVACDQTPSLLYINKGNGRFEEEALIRGVALDQDGKALSGMGVAAGDYLRSGSLSIFRTNFSDELETLYRNEGNGEFEDVSIRAGLAQNTRFVGWGCGFLDFDNDGWPDLLLVNGHAFPEVDRLNIDVHYRDRAILYRNEKGRFVDITAEGGPGLLERHSSRGAAFGDYDNDGAVEVLVNNQGEPPSLLHSSISKENHWLTVQLIGVRANRSGIGARVRVVSNGSAQLDEVRSGGSYLSQNDLRIHFGLGKAERADRLEVVWPGGKRQVELNVPADRVVRIVERQ